MPSSAHFFASRTVTLTWPLCFFAIACADAAICVGVAYAAGSLMRSRAWLIYAAITAPR
jgi:hypothetical protein